MKTHRPGGVVDSANMSLIKRAADLLQQRQWHAAEALLGGVSSSTSSHPEALRLLGIARHQLGQHDSALRCFQQALAAQPDNALLHLNMGSCHRSLEQIELAEAAYRRALELNPRLPAGWFNLGRLKLSNAFPEQSVDCFRRVLKLKPDYWQAALCLGHALKATGDLSGCAAAYRKGLQLRPGSGDLWWSLANIKTADIHEHEVQQMRNQISHAKSANQAIGIEFALGMALEARHDYAEAFTHFQRGNQIKRRSVAYDGVAKQDLGNRVISTFTPALLTSHATAGNHSAAPIFIVSLPRSGSTLIEQILASHPDVNGASELPDLGQLALSALGDDNGITWSPEKILELDDQQLTELGDRYIRATQRWHVQQPHFTDKMPNNFPLAGLIALILPQAKIINCRRHPIDTGLSCYRQLFAHGHHWSYDLDDIVSHYRYYDALNRHWAQLLPNQFLDVQYEQLLADQRGMTEKILAFCGLPWHESCMEFFKNKRVVRTASAGQVRQQLNTSAVNRWRQYEDFIKPLLALSADKRNNAAGIL